MCFFPSRKSANKTKKENTMWVANNIPGQKVALVLTLTSTLENKRKSQPQQGVSDAESKGVQKHWLMRREAHRQDPEYFCSDSLP